MTMTTVAVLLTEGFADWECGYLLGVGVAFYGLKAIVLTPDGRAVRSQGGMHVHPDGAAAQLPAAGLGALVVIGGTSWTAPDAFDVAPLLDVCERAGACVAAICGGTLALARAGRLDDRRHTSNALEFLKTYGAPTYHGANFYVDRPLAIRDGRLISAPGSAPVSFTAEMFRAVGIDETKIGEFTSMLAAEFDAADRGRAPG